MLLKGIISEDFVNYKKPSMLIAFPYCSFKCGSELCQNSNLANQPSMNIDQFIIRKEYHNNNITEAIVCQGLEPFDSWEDIKHLIACLRVIDKCHDDIVIYTGYNEDEIQDKINWLSKFDNIIVKFGRYIPGHEPHYDEVLGVYLASDNQYARYISNN